MSYDVGIRVKVEGPDTYVEVQDLGNITWNVRELILQSSGWEIKNEASNGEVLPWIKKIQHGYEELRDRPEMYKQYESPNGWGTVSGTRNFYENCLKNAEEFLSWREDLLPAAVIWVD